MVGRELTDQFPYIPPLENGETVLTVEGLTNEYVQDVSFEVKSGSIVGVARLASAQPTAGSSYEMDAIAAAVIGGEEIEPTIGVELMLVTK